MPTTPLTSEFLEGATGTALALHTAATATAPRPTGTPACCSPDTAPGRPHEHQHSPPTRTHCPGLAWQQVTIEFTNYAHTERITAERLAPVMNSGAGPWWYVRKTPHWRLRYLPEPPGTEGNVRGFVIQALEDLHNDGSITRWAETLYEPELHAFGGADAMTAAHQLFHQDSQHILARPPGTGDHRREHTILLCGALLRAAGLDWYEQGDVWARFADNRPIPNRTPTDRPSAHVTAIRCLMTVDIGPDSLLTQPAGQLAGITTWITAFPHRRRTHPPRHPSHGACAPSSPTT